MAIVSLEGMRDAGDGFVAVDARRSGTLLVPFCAGLRFGFRFSFWRYVEHVMSLLVMPK